jgi:ribosomal protein S18 acetylase RimI-like enzyme
MDRAVIEIRKAKLEDAREVARVHDEAWRSTYQGLIPHLHLENMIARRGPHWWTRSLRRGADLLLLVFNGTPQGYVAFGNARYTPVSGAGEIFELYMSPAYMGVGLGKRLFYAACRELEQRGRQSLIVWALEENESACAFYARLGGERFTRLPEPFGDVTLTRIAYFWPHIASRPTAKG